MLLEGGCECGKLRYRLAGPPIFVNCCHCRQCQKIGGSAFALNAMIESDRLELVAAPGAVAAGDDGAVRCSGCKTLLWACHRMFGDRIAFVRVGTLDEGERLAPDAHFFVRSKHPWVAIPDGARCFDTLPGEGDPPLLSAEAAARVEAARR